MIEFAPHWHQGLPRPASAASGTVAFLAGVDARQKNSDGSKPMQTTRGGLFAKENLDLPLPQKCCGINFEG